MTSTSVSALDAFFAKFGNDPILDISDCDANREATIKAAKVEGSNLLNGGFKIVFNTDTTFISLEGFEVEHAFLWQIDGNGRVGISIRTEGLDYLFSSDVIPKDERQVTWADVVADPARAAHMILEWWGAREGGADRAADGRS